MRSTKAGGGSAMRRALSSSMRSTLAFGSVAALVVGALAGCGSGDGKTSSTGGGGKTSSTAGLNLVVPGQLTVVALADQQGTSFVGNDGKVQGMAIDLMDAIGQRLGVKVTYRTQAIAGVIPAVSTHQYDTAAAGLLTTPERLRVVNFTQPWFYGQLLVINRKSQQMESNVEALTGKTLGVLSGSAQQKYAQTNFTKTKLKEYPQQPAMAASLLAGQIDAMFLGVVDGGVYLKRYPELTTVMSIASGLPNAFPVAKDRGALQTEMNKAMNALFEDGTYARLFKKWRPNLELPSELVAQHPSLKTAS